MPLPPRIALAIVASMLLSGTAFGQTAEPEVPAHPLAPKLDSKACTDRDRLTKGDTVETDGHAAPREDTSDKLARTDGVICPPPGLDPAIRAPAPSTQSDMPVIPPPAPGGDPDSGPK
jgi:hypothetical protein